MICESERLTLREMTLDDADYLLRHLNQPSWLKYIGDRGVRTLDDARKYIETNIIGPYRQLGYGMYLLTRKPDDEPVGMCGLVKRPWLPVPDLGVALLDEFAGRGYAVEATNAVMKHARDTLGIPRLLAIVNPANQRSIKLLGKLEFKLDDPAFETPQGETLSVYSK